MSYLEKVPYPLPVTGDTSSQPSWGHLAALAHHAPFPLNDQSGRLPICWHLLVLHPDLASWSVSLGNLAPRGNMHCYHLTWFSCKAELPAKAPPWSQCLKEEDLGITSQDYFIWEVCPRKYLIPEGTRVSLGSSLCHTAEMVLELPSWAEVLCLTSSQDRGPWIWRVKLTEEVSVVSRPSRVVLQALPVPHPTYSLNNFKMMKKA